MSIPSNYSPYDSILNSLIQLEDKSETITAEEGLSQLEIIKNDIGKVMLEMQNEITPIAEMNKGIEVLTLFHSLESEFQERLSRISNVSSEIIAKRESKENKENKK